MLPNQPSPYTAAIELVQRFRDPDRIVAMRGFSLCLWSNSQHGDTTRNSITLARVFMLSWAFDSQKRASVMDYPKKLSLIIPCYNEERTLAQCVKRVLAIATD